KSALQSAQRTLATEIEGLQSLSAALGDSFEHAVSVLAEISGRVIVSGMGKSGHVGAKIAATLASTGTPAQFVHPGEASHGDLGMITPADAVLTLSWSGETAELANLIDYAKRFSIPLIALTSGPDSMLGRQADICIALPKTTEACPNGLAPTTSTTMQLALGDALAVALLEERKFTPSDFKNFHPGGKLGAGLVVVQDVMHTAAALPLAPVGTRMDEALIVMTEKGFGCLGVQGSDDRLAGIISDGDLRRHMSGDLLSQNVEDIMTATPVTISADLVSGEALQIMNDRNIQCLFVCENERPVGLVRILDLLKIGVA
ncbi:MAG TPA: KpsF/GutQ family sugar-phosphate isomerase, partial [Rhodobiaceae bacterium]|nr:KpsF/GutQ family sugar-phosphate isomerase [Rhodobiaceae bacterium]